MTISTSRTTNVSTPSCGSVHELPAGTAVAGGFLALLGIPANLVVVMVVRKTKLKRSTLLYLILNLALTDIVNLIATESFLISEIILRPVWGAHLAFVRSILIPNDVAILTLTTIAVERFNALVRPMRPVANMSKKKMYLFVFVIWAVGILFNLPPIIITLVHRVSHCHHADINRGWYAFELTYSIISLVTFHVIPLVIYSYCYSKIIKGVFVDRTVLGGESFPNGEALAEKKTLVRTTISVTIVFIISCTSATVGLTVNSFGKGEDVLPKQYHSLVLLLKCLSSTVNPYLYYIQSKKYRAEVRQLIVTWKARKKMNDGDNEGTTNILSLV
ncbi:rhodopsin, GQ-coupled-like [Dendronephthya gigantea]|uniref:rhodopsin, GQ-coupled-like n=1 Tax=Dendronephthya gigantea TaxID=151771 RepID=UPI00106B570C|nr:rhodopsin, GQ-coupled-like [Dendronephthya gigantea]